MTIYPTGSVIKVREKLALIVGYDFAELEDKLRLHYLLVPYPTGFGKMEEVRLLPAQDAELMIPGFHTDVFAVLAQYFSQIDALAQTMPAAQMRACLKQAREILRTGGIQ